MVRLRTVILAALALAAFAPSLAQGPPPPQLWKRQGGVLSPRRAGDSVAIGPTLPGAVLGGTVAASNKYVVPYTNVAFKAAATEVSITLGAMPANARITALRLKHGTAFAGAGITAVACSLGDGTDHTIYSPAFDVFQAVGDTAMHQDGGSFGATAAAHNLVLRCTANTNFGDGSATVLTAGSLSIWLDVAVLQ